MTKSQTPKDKAEAKAKETADAVKTRAEEAVEDAKFSARDVAERARSDARAKAEDAVNNATANVAAKLDRTAGKIDEAAAEMTAGSPQADAAARTAQVIHSAATRIRETELSTLRDDVALLARRHPLAFAGAATLIGFAAGRFLKSSAPKPALPAPEAYPQATDRDTRGAA